MFLMLSIGYILLDSIIIYIQVKDKILQYNETILHYLKEILPLIWLTTVMLEALIESYSRMLRRQLSFPTNLLFQIRSNDIMWPKVIFLSQLQVGHVITLFSIKSGSERKKLQDYNYRKTFPI